MRPSSLVPSFVKRLLADGRLRVARSYVEALGHVEHHLEMVLSSIERYEVDGNKEFAEQAEHHCRVIIEKGGAPADVHKLVNKIIGRSQCFRYRFYPIAAEMMVYLAQQPECRREFDDKTEFQERASQYHLSSALGLLKAVGYYDRAREILSNTLAESAPGRGSNVIFWDRDNVHFTPSITIGPRGAIHAKPWWTDDARLHHLQQALRENHARIAAEVREVVAHKNAQLSKAYERLTFSGDWDMVPLYTHKRFNAQICQRLPVTSEVLRSLNLFRTDLPNLVYNSEEATIFRVSPGTKVQLHNGGTNARINVSLGLFGCEGSCITLGGAGSVSWRDGETLAFDDGWDHAVTHAGSEDRWVLTLGIRHPDLLDNLHLFLRAQGPKACVSPWRTEYEEISGLNQGRFKRLKTG